MDSSAAQIGLRSPRALLAPRPDPYAGIDLPSRRRVGGLLLAAGTALGAALTLVSPPTEAIGGTGWLVGAALLASCLVMAFLILRPGSKLGFDGMLAIVYVGIAQIAIIEWLAGGHGTPYHWLYLSAAVFPPSIHPPRRAAGIVVVASVAVALPLTYSNLTSALVADIGLEIAFIAILAVAAMIVMDAVREHALELQRESKEARELARIDPLTGLQNRRAFDERLRDEAAQAEAERPLSLIVLDLDDFKAINDEQGHQRGDLVLKEVAAALRSAVRSPDACFRWGGDEFAVVLPGTPPDAALAVAARVQDAMASDVSYGVATLCDAGPAAALLATADGALAAAKAALA